MRVALVTNERLGQGLRAPGGFSSRYTIMARSLVEIGHEVLVISFGKRRSDEPVPIEFVDHGSTYWGIETVGQAFHTTQYPQRAFRAVALRLGTGRFGAPWEKRVFELVSDFRPDAGLVLAPYRPETCALLPRRLPFAYFAEEDLTTFLDGSFTAKPSIFSRELRPNIVVTISHHETPWSRRTYPDVVVSVVPHVVDIDYWANPNVSAALGAPSVLAAGDFSEARNYEGLASVLTKLDVEANAPPFEVGVASALPLPDHLSNSDRASLRVLGAVDDLRPLYRGSEVTLVPALRVTGVKTQILQAWAAGCPVVTSIDAARSVDGEDGVDLLAAPDPDGMIKCLHKVLSSSDLRGTLAENGREKVERLHSIQAMSKAVESLLIDLVSPS